MSAHYNALMGNNLGTDVQKNTMTGQLAPSTTHVKPHAIKFQNNNMALTFVRPCKRLKEVTEVQKCHTKGFWNQKSEAPSHNSGGCTGEQRTLECALFFSPGLVKCPDIQKLWCFWRSTLQRWILKGSTLQCWWSDGRVGWRWWTILTRMLFTAVRRWTNLTPITPPPGFFFNFLFFFFKFLQSYIEKTKWRNG